MQLRSYMSAKIHKAVVTRADLNYVGSVTIDKALLEKTGLQKNEKVLIVSNTSGARLETYIIEGDYGSGAIEINGAAAHLIQPGEEIIIIAFTLSTEPVVPKAVLVNKKNEFVEYLDEKAGVAIY